MENETDLTIVTVEMAGALAGANCPMWGIPLCQLVSASKRFEQLDVRSTYGYFESR